MTDGVPPFRVMLGISNERGQWVRTSSRTFTDIGGAEALFEALKDEMIVQTRTANAREISALAVAKGMTPSKLSAVIADITEGRTGDRYALSTEEARTVLEQLREPAMEAAK